MAMMLVAGFASAQQILPQSLMHNRGAIRLDQNIQVMNNAKGLGDTAGMSVNYMPALNMANLVGGYVMTNSSSVRIGYWWGTSGTVADTSSDVWIQCYEATDASVLRIAGIGFYCVNYDIQSGNGQLDTVELMLNKIYSDGCGIGYNSGAWTYGPGPAAYLNTTGATGSLLGTLKITVPEIDTSLSNGPVFNYRAFPEPITVTGSSPAYMFAVCANFHSPRMNGDTVYFCCDDNGDGAQLSYSQSGNVCPDGANYYLPTSNYFTYNGTAGGLDNNGAIFAVMASTIGVDESYLNGVKLNIRNSSNGAILDYSLKNNGKVSLQIHDINGKYVKGFNQGVQMAGDYSLDLQTSNLPAGSYLVIMNAAGKHVAKQFVIQ